MPRGELTRIQELASRVHWLDRRRRALAILAALIVAPVVILQVAELGNDWPRVHEWMLIVVVGVMVWWIAEVALAWLAAFWETECYQLMRERGLPRATVHRR